MSKRDADYHQSLYAQLYASLERQIGRVDPHTIVALIGFDNGGPLNFCTIGAGNASVYTTYISCELAVHGEQQPGEHGRYELLASCNDERWVRSVLSEVGRMSMDVAFGDGDTLDIGAWVEEDDSLQGIIFEEVLVTEIGGEGYAILRCIGITRDEMEYALEQGSHNLIALLQDTGVYPHTVPQRASVV